MSSVDGNSDASKGEGGNGLGACPGYWVPYSPNGVALRNLAGESEATAWRNLMLNQRELRYYGRSQFEEHGWTVRYEQLTYNLPY